MQAQAVRQRIEQGLPRRLDDVGADADGDPGVLAVGRLDQHPRDRVGAVALVEDPDPEVDQVEPRDVGIELLDRLPQRVVERVDRAVALADDGEALRRRRRA